MADNRYALLRNFAVILSHRRLNELFNFMFLPQSTHKPLDVRGRVLDAFNLLLYHEISLSFLCFLEVVNEEFLVKLWDVVLFPDVNEFDLVNDVYFGVEEAHLICFSQGCHRIIIIIIHIV